MRLTLIKRTNTHPQNMFTALHAESKLNDMRDLSSCQIKRIACMLFAPGLLGWDYWVAWHIPQMCTCWFLWLTQWRGVCCQRPHRDSSLWGVGVVFVLVQISMRPATRSWVEFVIYEIGVTVPGWVSARVPKAQVDSVVLTFFYKHVIFKHKMSFDD